MPHGKTGQGRDTSQPPTGGKGIGLIWYQNGAGGDVVICRLGKAAGSKLITGGGPFSSDSTSRSTPRPTTDLPSGDDLRLYSTCEVREPTHPDSQLLRANARARASTRLM